MGVGIPSLKAIRVITSIFLLLFRIFELSHEIYSGKSLQKKWFLNTTFVSLTVLSFQGIKEGWYDGGSIALAVMIVIVVTGMVMVIKEPAGWKQKI